jgi:hypothetical protein
MLLAGVQPGNETLAGEWRFYVGRIYVANPPSTTSAPRANTKNTGMDVPVLRSITIYHYSRVHSIFNKPDNEAFSSAPSF